MEPLLGGESLIRSPLETTPSSSSTNPGSSSYPAYLSMYSKGSGFDPIAAPARNMESEKLRKIRRRKELKEYRKYTKVVQYKTLGDDKNYNLAAVLESLESSQKLANSTHNNPNNNNQLSNNNHVNVNNNNNNVSNNGNKDNRKDNKGKVRRLLSRRRSNQGAHNNSSSSSSVKTYSHPEASSSSEDNNGLKDEEEEDEEDKMSSSSLVGGGGPLEDPLFKQPKQMERGLSKSSENLSHYSSDNLNSFTKVTNKKQKWKKKNAHSVEMPDHFNVNNNGPLGKGGTRSSFHNGYNLRNREPPRPDLDLNAKDFPPLDARVEEGGDVLSPPISKQAPLSSVSSSSSSVLNERDEEESQEQKLGDLPDVTVREPPPLNSNACITHLPDLTAEALESSRSSEEAPPEVERSGLIRKVGDIAIALTEEEYRRQDPSIPVVIFGRSSSAIRDWTSKADNFEFGFEVNESLLAMSSSEPSQPPRPPDVENKNLPLDHIDKAILSFGDSVTNLTVLGDETSAESPLPDDSIHVPPYVEEPVTFNYNEVINYLESAWLESLKDKKPQCHPVASSAY